MIILEEVRHSIRNILLDFGDADWNFFDTGSVFHEGNHQLHIHCVYSPENIPCGPFY